MNLFKRFIGHTKTIIKHKFWVWHYMNKCGFKWGWRGLWHDMSKFSPIEFWESVKYYSGTRSPIDACKEENGISMAWMHHKGRNPHHYEYWMDNFDKGGEPKEMPWRYKVEMICDYLAAARAYMGKSFSYRAEYEWWNNKMKQPRRQHFNDMAFVGRVLQSLAEYEKINGSEYVNKMFKYILIVEKDHVLGGFNEKV